MTRPIAPVECICDICGKLGECTAGENGPPRWFYLTLRGADYEGLFALACSAPCRAKAWKRQPDKKSVS